MMTTSIACSSIPENTYTWHDLGGVLGPVVPDSPMAYVVPSWARTLIASPDTTSGVGPLSTDGVID